jgi:hypothetical protein
MRIVLAGGTDNQAQAAFGTLTSWDPRTGVIGFRSAFSPEVQQLQVKSVGFSLEKPPMQAQMPMPTIIPIANVSRTYTPSEISIENGVVHLPGCAPPSTGRTYGFEGILAFSSTGVNMQGTFYEIQPPSGGGLGTVGGKRG